MADVEERLAGLAKPDLKACSVAFKPVGKLKPLPYDFPEEMISDHIFAAYGVPKEALLGEVGSPGPKPLQLSFQWKCGCCVKVPYIMNLGQPLFAVTGLSPTKCDMANGCHYDPDMVGDILADASHFRELNVHTCGPLLGDARWSVEER
jgi:hypothetical protein